MPNNPTVEVVEEVSVQKPMSGAEMAAQLAKLKKDKELKQPETPK